MNKTQPMHPLLTPWGEDIDRDCPLNDYPRPQLRRAGWRCLNGPWQYAIRDDDARPDAWDGDILVPFSPESLLSGVGRQLLPGQTLWYRRLVHFEALAAEKRLLLHFGAVDQHCTVYVGGQNVGGHSGGYWPFSLDITDAVGEGENLIEVRVTDDTDTGSEAWGKQRLERGKIWYTGQSGIWQTVWCEEVPDLYIQGLRVTPLWREAAVEVEVAPSREGAALPGAVEVLDGGAVVARCALEGGRARIPLPGFKSWSPDDPFLYGLRVSAKEDEVESYFGMREFGIVTGRDGHPRLTLNGEPIFHNGLLDQGYWSDGMYTPPSDEAMVWEIEKVKSLGYNMLRKHIKIEPMRWYYHCDRLGILVWQDFVSGGGVRKHERWLAKRTPRTRRIGNGTKARERWERSDRGGYNPLVVQVAPFLGLNFGDGPNRYGLHGRADALGREVFRRDMARTVDLLRSVVSIAVWVPFNEGWGQFDAAAIAGELRALDNSRPIDHASGYFDQGAGDFHSYHVYFKRFRPKPDARGEGRVLALTEFGGYSLPAPGHMATDELYGYKVFETRQALGQALAELYEKDVEPYIPRGLGAIVYTQVSDVEDEINGLFTYDRRVVKPDEAMLRDLNRRLRELFEKSL